MTTQDMVVGIIITLIALGTLGYVLGRLDSWRERRRVHRLVDQLIDEQHKAQK